MGKPTGGGGVQAKASAFHKGDVIFMRNEKGYLYRAGTVSVSPARSDKELVLTDEKGKERRAHPLELYHTGARVIHNNERQHIVPPKGTLVAVKGKGGKLKYRLQKEDEWKRSDDLKHRLITKDVTEYSTV